MKMNFLVWALIACIFALSRGDEETQSQNSTKVKESEDETPHPRSSCAGSCNIQNNIRFSCGAPGAGREECLSKGCCFDETNNYMKCFKKDQSMCPKAECDAVLPEYRIKCDIPPAYQNYSRIIFQEPTYCIHMGCCWDNTYIELKYPSCFKKAEVSKEVQILVNKQSGCVDVPKSERQKCGNYIRSITEHECNRRNCCWRPVNDGVTPSCFYKVNVSSSNTPQVLQPLRPVYGITENIATDSRPREIPRNCMIDYFKPCGSTDITYDKCKAQGCCWDHSNSVDGINCFSSKNDSVSITKSTPTPALKKGLEIHPAPTDVYGKVIGSGYQAPVVDTAGQQQSYNIFRIPRQTNQISNRTSRYSTPGLSPLAQMMIFCGKNRGKLCNVALLSMMAGNKVTPASKLPTMNNYMNYVIKRRPFKDEGDKDLTSVSNDGRMNNVKASSTRNYEFDEMCFNTTQFKKHAEFQSPCGGLYASPRIMSEKTCIEVGCCWVDNYNSLLRKAFKLDEQSPQLLRFFLPMLDITDDVNCIEPLSFSQIKRIGEMSVLGRSYSMDNEHSASIPPQVLPMLLADDDDSPMSSLMMSMLTGNNNGKTNVPALLWMATKEDDSKVILPLIMDMLNNQNQQGPLSSPNPKQSGSTLGLKEILPLLMMEKGDSSNGMMAIALSQMSGNGLDPLMMMSLLGDKSDSKSIVPFLLMMNKQQRNPNSESQVWSAPTGNDAADSPAHNPETQGSTDNTQTTQTGQQGMGLNPLLLLSLIDGDESSLQDILPIVMAQQPRQGAGSSTRNFGGIESMIPFLLSGEDEDMSSKLMMAVAMSQSNPSADVQDKNMMSMLIPLLLSKKDNGSKMLDKVLMMMQMSSTANPQLQSLMYPLLMSEGGAGIDPMSMMFLSNPSMVPQNPMLVQSMMSMLPNEQSESSIDPQILQFLMSSPQINNNNNNPSSTDLTSSLPLILAMSEGNIDPLTMMLFSGSVAPQGSTPGPLNLGLNPALLENNNNILSNHQLLNSFGTPTQSSMPLSVIQMLLNSPNGMSNDGILALLASSNLLGQPTNQFTAQLPAFPPQQSALPNFMPPRNPFQIGSGFAGHFSGGMDNEHSYNQASESNCMFPPGAIKVTCEPSLDSQHIMTKHDCTNQNCCWDAQAEQTNMKCYRPA